MRVELRSRGETGPAPGSRVSFPAKVRNPGQVGPDLRALYGGAYRRLVGQVYALTHDRDAAERCVREAFVRAMGLGRWFGRRDDPEARLRTVALRIARRRRRSASPSNDPIDNADPTADSGQPPAVAETGAAEPDVDERDVVEPDLVERDVVEPDAVEVTVAGPAVEPSASPATQQLLKSLGELPVGDRDAGSLGILAQLPAAEIAALLGSSPTRIEARLARTRKRLGAVEFGVPLVAAVREARVWIEQSVTPPPYDFLVVAARRRRRRQGIFGAAGAMVLVAAAVTVPMAVRDHQPGPRVPVSQVRFLDRNHAYALAQPCHKSQCTLQIVHTSDAGKHWTAINIPHGPLTGMTNGVALSICCGNRLAVTYSRLATDAERGQQLAASDGTIRIHAVSDDAGKHWNSAPDRSDGLQLGPPTLTVPTGWSPITDYGLTRPTVVAMNTVDGVERPLQHQPPLVSPDISVPFRPGERLWITGGAKRDQLAYSDDQGNSWHSMAAPPLAAGQAITAVFPRPGGSLYVQTRTAGGKQAGPTWRLDPPAHWTKLAAFGLGPNAVAGTVLPSGELWISDTRFHTWRTESGGTTVHEITGPHLDGANVGLALAGVTPDGTIYALEPPGGRQDVVFTSRDDGRHWTTHDIRVPKPKHS